MKNAGGQESREDERNAAAFFIANYTTIGANQTGFARITDGRSTGLNVSHTMPDASDLHATDSFGGEGNIQFTFVCGQIIRVNFVT